MTAAFVKHHTAGTSKTSGTTVTCTLSSDVPIGNEINVWVAFDNTGSSTPAVNSLSVPSGETATWTRIAQHNSSASGGAAGCRGELWSIRPKQQWPSGTVITATLASAVTAKVALPFECSGVTVNLRGTAGAGTSTSGAPSATTGGTTPAIGDMVIGCASCENDADFTGDTDTTGGAWGTAAVAHTTGSTAATNIAAIVQVKVVTSGGNQTYNPGGGAADAGAVVVALVPAPPTVVAPIAAYNFDEASGDVLDVSGNGHAFTPTGTTTRISDGTADGTGYTGKGLGQSSTTVETGPALFGQTLLRTLMFWAKFSASFTGWIWEYHDNGDDTGLWGFLSLSGNMGFRGRNAGGTIAFASRAAVLDSAWHHWCGTFDGSNVRLYFDGVFVTAVPCAGPLRTDSDVLNVFTSMGSGNQIRHLRVFDQPLEPETILALKNEPVAASVAAEFTGWGVPI